MTRLLSAAARRLTDTLGELKVRVREAVAGETGRAVADAVRSAVTAALAGDADEEGHHRPSHDPWDDPHADRWAEAGGWHEADDVPPRRCPGRV